MRKTISISIEESIAEELKRKAAKKHRSVSSQAEEILRKGLRLED